MLRCLVAGLHKPVSARARCVGRPTMRRNEPPSAPRCTARSPQHSSRCMPAWCRVMRFGARVWRLTAAGWACACEFAGGVSWTQKPAAIPQDVAAGTALRLAMCGPTRAHLVVGIGMACVQLYASGGGDPARRRAFFAARCVPACCVVRSVLRGLRR